MHGGWVVKQQGMQYRQHSMGGGIGIIASLLFPTREAPSLYAFSYATLSLDPVAGLARWRPSGLCRALQGRLEHAQSYRRQANRPSLQSV